MYVRMVRVHNFLYKHAYMYTHICTPCPIMDVVSIFFYKHSLHTDVLEACSLSAHTYVL